MKPIVRKSFIKRFLSTTILKVLGIAVQAIEHLDKTTHNELSDYKDGCVIGMKAFPEGQTMFLMKKDGYFFYFGLKSSLKPDYLITFKSLDDAIPVLCGLKGIEQAFIEHRFTLEGDLMTSLPLVRALGIVEAYLFPTFMLRKLFIKIPERNKSRFKGYLTILKTTLNKGRLT